MPPRRQQERPGHRAQARRGAGQEGGRREGRDRPGPGREVRPAAARARPGQQPRPRQAALPRREGDGPGPSDRRRGEVHRARDTRGPRGLPGARARRGEAVRAGGTDGRDRRLAGGQERPRSGVPRPRESDLGAAPAPGRAGARRFRVTESYLACPETGSQGRRGRCGAKASWSRASAPRRRRKPPTEGAGGTFRGRFPVFGLFENQHRRPGRREPRNPRQRLRHARAGSRRRKERRGQRGAWARRGTRGLQRTRPMRKTDLLATGR